MSYAARSTQYLEADVMSRSPEWLVPLLYEHLLSSLRRAGAQIESGDIEGKAASLDRATAIVMELLGSLDTEKGGEIAERLGSLYGFFAGEILTASRTLDVARLDRLIAMITELHASWVAAAESVAPRGRGGSAGYGARLA
jgi:flagellar secretion chaperone FliS